MENSWRRWLWSEIKANKRSNGAERFVSLPASFAARTPEGSTSTDTQRLGSRPSSCMVCRKASGQGDREEIENRNEVGWYRGRSGREMDLPDRLTGTELSL